MQKMGVAMGSNMAPTYANVFMRCFEEDVVYVSHHFRHVLAWWRYIDNVFLIWTGQVDQLMDFHRFLNSVYDSLQFTLVYSATNLQFLDTEVLWTNDGF